MVLNGIQPRHVPLLACASTGVATFTTPAQTSTCIGTTLQAARTFLVVRGGEKKSIIPKMVNLVIAGSSPYLKDDWPTVDAFCQEFAIPATDPPRENCFVGKPYTPNPPPKGRFFFFLD